MERKKLHVKTGDIVTVISGKDKGKKGKVLKALPKEGKVLVEGVNVVTKHKRARSPQDQGGIIHQEAPIFASKVMLYCNNCGKGVRYGVKILADGEKIRYCKKCGETL
ncbi:50S ribosomal protein L24 [Thermoanaerobacterium saccharolyticum]|uniref:Large ribosomal subunit protein uL24 n=3 Tax=Thermoanaerobacterium TaxID=28895 RepID=W9EH13_9THEO|nr:MULTISPECIES: 50S ribosomal protein L24 [Thermoanaerobacterium]MDI3309847.1 50S ribosomal protein L24 [Thermoanaerobacterium sp.]AEF16401.1 ribosomal protein L24 [Thermoanaerobacterium xylanolyticum LX-11]AFK86038.1 ribosomal protein L24 [Thermoanaerobacterium saccharolyticum JW/SL-YS485]ETO39004.1 50S ribosomal protein L24 [Thermoanaerobacterium aotearoense SCUT27]MDE4543385.1 50S ribosomal protein L24 [Thermoanaerobacterium sp. R66]